MQVGYLGRSHIHDNSASLKPWLIEGIDNAVSIAAGRSTGAAVLRNGTIFTWGSQPLGRPGSGFVPGEVHGLQGVGAAKVCLGEYHGVAITKQGTLVAWGSTGDEQVKEVAGVPLSQTAGQLYGWPDGLRATGLACGFQHTLVVGSRCSIQPTADATANTTWDGTPVQRRTGGPAVGQLQGEDSASNVPSATSEYSMPSGSLTFSTLFSFSPTAEGLIAKPDMLSTTFGTVSATTEASAASITQSDHDIHALASPVQPGSIAGAPEVADLQMDGVDITSPRPDQAYGATYAPLIAATQLAPSALTRTQGLAAGNEPNPLVPRAGARARTTVWSVEQCPQGSRPPWLPDCTAVLADNNVPSLDKAWHGQFAPAARETVCLPSSVL
jgi:hypothetical protein